MKISLKMALGGVCVALGGMISVHLNGADAFSIQLWRLAFEGVILQPKEISSEAVAGDDAAFFVPS